MSTQTTAVSSMSIEAMVAKIAELEAAIKKQHRKDGDGHTALGLTLRVSEKKAISIYGFGKYPHTFYYDQLMKLAADMAEVVAYAEANKSKLSLKSAE